MSEIDRDYIEPLIEEALRRVGYTHDFERDIMPMLLEERAQWWCRDQGVIITELVQFPNFKVCNYWLVAGCLEDCLELQPEINRWAVAQGCSRAIGMGRRGWLRVLPKYGWKPYGIGFAKDLRQ